MEARWIQSSLATEGVKFPLEKVTPSVDYQVRSFIRSIINQVNVTDEPWFSLGKDIKLYTDQFMRVWVGLVNMLCETDEFVVPWKHLVVYTNQMMALADRSQGFYNEVELFASKYLPQINNSSVLHQCYSGIVQCTPYDGLKTNPMCFLSVDEIVRLFSYGIKVTAYDMHQWLIPSDDRINVFSDQYDPVAAPDLIAFYINKATVLLTMAARYRCITKEATEVLPSIFKNHTQLMPGMIFAVCNALLYRRGMQYLLHKIRPAFISTPLIIERKWFPQAYSINDAVNRLNTLFGFSFQINRKRRTFDFFEEFVEPHLLY